MPPVDGMKFIEVVAGPSHRVLAPHHANNLQHLRLWGRPTGKQRLPRARSDAFRADIEIGFYGCAGVQARLRHVARIVKIERREFGVKAGSARPPAKRVIKASINWRRRMLRVPAGKGCS